MEAKVDEFVVQMKTGTDVERKEMGGDGARARTLLKYLCEEFHRI